MKSREKLEAAVEALALEGLGKVEEGSADAIRDAAKTARSFLYGAALGEPINAVALQALDLVESAAPKLGEIAREEARELLVEGWVAVDTDTIGVLRDGSYEAGREAMRAITAAEARKALAREQRLKFLADLLQDLGSAAVRILPFLITAL